MLETILYLSFPILQPYHQVLLFSFHGLLCQLIEVLMITYSITLPISFILAYNYYTVLAILTAFVNVSVRVNVSISASDNVSVSFSAGVSANVTAGVKLLLVLVLLLKLILTLVCNTNTVLILYISCLSCSFIKLFSFF